MKYRLFTLILALSLVGWTQVPPSASTSPNSTPAPQTNGCCHHNMAQQADQSCCHPAADAKDAASCCSKDKCEMKDGKSCCAGKKMKAAMKECKKHGGCTEGKCCEKGENCGTDDKTATGCCGSKCEDHSHMPAMG